MLIPTPLHIVAVVDTTSISTQTPNSVLLPGWSSWSAWSDCNVAMSVSVNTQIRSRLCRLDRGAGAILSSIEPCLLLEQAGGDLEVRDCESMNSVTVLSSRVLEEDEVFSNDISMDATVQSTASSSSIETIEGNTVTLHTTMLKRTTEHLNGLADNTTLANGGRNNTVMGE